MKTFVVPGLGFRSLLDSNFLNNTYRKVDALFSYYEIMNRKSGFEVKDEDGIRDIFLDSGAFSAWRRNINLDVHRYIDFIKQNRDKYKYYAYLDVIFDYEATKKNIEIMVKAGLNDGLPTFHVGEPFDFLRWLVERFDYIGLGGMVSYKGRDDIIRWLDYIFSNYPDKKFHGFGVSDFGIMKLFPFHSVDSTSPVLGGGHGTVYYDRDENVSLIHYSAIQERHLDRSKIAKLYMKHYKTDLKGVIHLLQKAPVYRVTFNTVVWNEYGANLTHRVLKEPRLF